MKSKSAFTLIELLVVIAIIAILAAILFPVFMTAKDSAKRTTCATHQKQLAMSIIQYAQDNDNRFPPYCRPVANPTEYWAWMIQKYVKNYDVFICPSNPNNTQLNSHWYGKSNFVFNFYYLNYPGQDNQYKTRMLSEPRTPSKTVMICDGAWDDSNPPQERDYMHVVPPSVYTGYIISRPAFRHNGYCNVAWVDGHMTSEMNKSAFYPAKRVAKSDTLWDLK